MRTTTADHDLHTIQTYLSDALALEKHIAQPLARQLDLDDSAKFEEAIALITTIKSMTDTHIAHLERHLELAGGASGRGGSNPPGAELLGGRRSSDQRRAQNEGLEESSRRLLGARARKH